MCWRILSEKGGLWDGIKVRFVCFMTIHLSGDKLVLDAPNLKWGVLYPIIGVVMRVAYLFTIAVVALSGCASSQKTSPSPAKGENFLEIAEAIRAFEDICLKNSPSFSGSVQAAAPFGVTSMKDVGFMKLGFNKDKSLSVQIKENKECAITTDSQPSATLTRQFLQVVGKYSTKAPVGRVPVRADIKGVSFLFHHDRRDGEAFVMLKADS